MKTTIRWNCFAAGALFLSLTAMLCLWSIDSSRAQDKTGGAVGANAQAEDLLDLRGDVPNTESILVPTHLLLPAFNARY
jgi:hypothetical protein